MLVDFSNFDERSSADHIDSFGSQLKIDNHYIEVTSQQPKLFRFCAMGDVDTHQRERDNIMK